jgi:hypothetical protein
MGWPLPSDFSRSLQNPQVTLRDPELRTCKIEKDKSNQPIPRSGGFAVVFKAHLPGNQAVALRVFKSGLPERLERYNAISACLDPLTLPCLVKFKFDPEGVRSLSDGKPYPLIRMDWVQGESLYDWVRAKCLARDARGLMDLADKWVQLIADLAKVGLAHGDLQHGNVMVTNAGQLKLVDYDCMCVPALHGRLNAEIGLPPYQHPGRDERTKLSARLDDFSALFILVALRALAADPGLWSKYVERPNQEPYEKLLIRQEDLQEPGRSALYRDLMKSPDTDLRELAAQLFDCYRSPLDRVPALADTLNSYSKIEVLLQNKQWDAAVELMQRKTTAQRAKAPAHLQARLSNAEARVAARKALEQAIEHGDEAGMSRLYDPRLLDDYPQAQAAVNLAREAAAALQALLKLDQLRHRKDWRGLLATWTAQEALLAKRKSAAKLLQEVPHWRARNQACDRFLAAVRQPAADDAASLACWQQLEALGGHTEAETYRAAMERLSNRARAWQAFRQVPLQLAETVDRSLVAAWQEPLFARWPEAERERPRYVQAQARLAVLEELGRLDGNGVPSVAGEQALERCAARLPDGYVYARQDRVHLAGQRLRVRKELEELLSQPGTEKAVIGAWRRLVHLRGESLVPPALLPQITLLEDRLPAWTKFQEIPRSSSEAADQAALASWNEELFAGWPEAESQRPRLLEAQERLQIVDKIRALDRSGTGLDEAVEIAIIREASRLPDGYETSQQKRVASAVRRVRALRHLRRSLREPISDLALADNWAKLVQAGGEELAARADRQRAALAVKRSALLKALDALDRSLPPHQFDQQLIEGWDATLLKDCQDAHDYTALVQRAVERRRLLHDLQTALEKQDDIAIATLSGSSALQGYPFAPAVADQIGAAVKRAKHAMAILEALRSKDQHRLRDVFDAATIRRYEGLFQPHQALLQEWLKTSLLTLERLGLASPAFRRSGIVPLPEQGVFKISWTWPEPRFTDRCLFTICRDKPQPEDRNPEGLVPVLQQPINRKGWEDAGGSLKIRGEDSYWGGYVVVWAVIDLGKMTCYSEPLLLGRLAPLASNNGSRKHR